jgi:hypothetical protein
MRFYVRGPRLFGGLIGLGISFSPADFKRRRTHTCVLQAQPRSLYDRLFLPALAVCPVAGWALFCWSLTPGS